MESMIRKMVKEEVSKAINPSSTKETQLPSSSTQSTASTSKASKNRTANVSSRLNSLLTKITKKSDPDASKKSFKIQVRWRRTDGLGETTVVKIGNGGGHRFITFEPDEVATMKELLEKSMEIFFISSGFNFFGEYRSEVEFELQDMTETTVDLLSNIQGFLKERGYFPSKCWFYLKTYPKQSLDISSLSDDLDDDDFKHMNDILKPTKRKISLRLF